jgi:hypothetical protein
MNKFPGFSEDRRRLYCEQAQEKFRLPPASIEKDFWVCWTLKELFGLAEWGNALTFKGGTSLSKGWALIERLSEDVDIVIDRHALGFGGEKAPDKAQSGKQIRKRLEALKEASRSCVNEKLLPLLHDAFSKSLTDSASWSLDPDPDDPDKQTLLFTYPSVFFDKLSYVRQTVKIEMGTRSDTEPTLDTNIHPYLADAFPGIFTEAVFSVKAVSPVRTFWEKAMLLHEETFRPPGRKRKARLARHYYDLWCLIKAGIGGKAADDIELFKRIAAHRQVYFSYNWVDYDTLRPGSIKLVPPDKHLPDWRADYNSMRQEMFFGEVPSFENIMQSIAEFQDGFNRKSAGCDSIHC